MSLKDDFHDAVQGFKWVISDLDADEKRKQAEREKEKNTVLLTCPYCGAKARIVWQEGVLPKCPNCGGMFDMDAETWQRMKPKAEEEPYPKAPGASKGGGLSNGRIRLIIVAIVAVVVLLAAVGLYGAMHGGSFHMSGDATFEMKYSQNKQGEEKPAAESGEDSVPEDEQDEDTP